MSKKRKFTKKLPSKPRWKDTAMQAAGVVVGVAAAGALKKAITKETLQGLGLNGEVSNYVVPGVMLATGIAGSVMVKDKFVKSAALGITAVGTAGLVNEFAGKQVIALGNPETKMLPGIGNPALPGMGATPYIPQPLNRPQDNQERELTPNLSQDTLLMGCI